MATTYYFLDTEWADVIGSELVSLALVNEDGDRHFYAERANLPEAPTDFVRQSVYPLLDRGGAALPDAALTTGLRAFLNVADAPAVMADFPNDLQLLKYALDGFELSLQSTLGRHRRHAFLADRPACRLRAAQCHLGPPSELAEDRSALGRH